MSGYGLAMIKKLLDRFKRITENNQSEEDQTVDISRVIPGYQTPEATEPTSESADGEMASKGKTDINTDDVEKADDVMVNIESDSDFAEALLEGIEPVIPEDKNTAWLKRDLSRLFSAWTEVQETPGKMENLVRANHDLKGMAGNYGYPAIERLSNSLDKLLSSGSAVAHPALINLHVEACRAAFTNGSKGDAADSVSTAVCDALEEQVKLAVA
ncbi:MAG: Hpt domain-containing protein [Pseudomonadota bacterium]